MPLFDSTVGDVSYPVVANRLSVGSLSYGTNTAVASATLTAENISGGTGQVALALTGTLTGAANATLPTVAALIAANPSYVSGQMYQLRIRNESAGAYTWTVATATGWTLNGTMTIAQTTYRDFFVTITSLTTATLQGVGGSTIV